MARRAAPPSDPGLRSFLEELGRMAADALLARVRNGLNTKGVGEASISSPRGTHRAGSTPEAKAEGPQGPVPFNSGSVIATDNSTRRARGFVSGGRQRQIRSSPKS